MLGFGFGGVAIAAAVVALAVGMSQAAGTRACAAVLSAADAAQAGQAQQAAACGGYLEVHGPDGSVRVEVIDQCPGCGDGHIDLSEAAFSVIAPLNQGLINVTYQQLATRRRRAPSRCSSSRARRHTGWRCWR